MARITRGIDHIGITVPNLDAATKFFIDALGAEVLYDTIPRGTSDQFGPEIERRLHLRPGGAVVACRALRLANGPGLELFEMVAPLQEPAAHPSDIGLQHFGVYVDDMQAAVEAFRRAGGEIFADPHEIGGLESGPGNLFCYGQTPWGTVIELITYPSPMPYEQTTPLRRFTPAP